MSRSLRMLPALLGLAVLVLVLREVDLEQVWHHVASVGWGFTLVLAISALWHLSCAGAWRASFDRRAERPGLWLLLKVKLKGEALASLAPAPQVGQEVAKAFLTRRHLTLDKAISAQVISKTAETLGGLLFILAGAGVALAWLPLAVRSRWALGISLGAVLLTAGALMALGKPGPVRRLLNMAARTRLPFPTPLRDGLSQVEERATHFYCQGWRKTATPLMLHLLCWVLGVLEIYVVLHLIGSPLSIVSCFVFRAALVAATTVLCFVPMGAGVFEAGHVIILHWLGVVPAVATSAAVIRRARKSLWILSGGLMPIPRHPSNR